MHLKAVKIASVFVIGIFAVYFGIQRGKGTVLSENVTPFPSPAKTLFSPTPTPAMETEKTLSEIIRGLVSGSEGIYGIAVKNLETNETYFQNENIQFDSASLYKLWVMATVYDQLEKERLKTDDILSQEIPVLNRKFNIASESAEQLEGTITANVQEALEKMITISDNYSALLLSEKVGLSKVSVFLRDHGLSDSSLGEPPKTSAADTAFFLEKLYRGEFPSSKEMLKLLLEQKINHKLPKYLPASLAIAHKTGELNNFSHDAGIVFSQRGDYIIVILSESQFPDKAEETIAQISKAVFDYWEESAM